MTTNIFTRISNNFYFIPNYALDHMVNGLSKEAYYVDYKTLVRANAEKFPPYFDHKSFYPKVDIYIPHIFKRYIISKLKGSAKFLGFSPNTFFYNFFGGFALLVIWKLGGGYRIAPINDPACKFNVVGFYDLKYTPLATLCYYFYIYQSLMGTFTKENYADYYIYNNNSLDLYYDNNRSNRGPAKISFVRLLIHILFAPIRLLYAFFHHFILRHVLHLIAVFLLTPRETIRRPFDRYWGGLYKDYLSSVCEICGMQQPRFLVEGEYFYTNMYYYMQYWQLQRYKRLTRFLGNGRVWSTYFAETDAKTLHAQIEHAKMDKFKKFVLQQSMVEEKVSTVFPKKLIAGVLFLYKRRMHSVLNELMLGFFKIPQEHISNNREQILVEEHENVIFSDSKKLILFERVGAHSYDVFIYEFSRTERFSDQIDFIGQLNVLSTFYAFSLYMFNSFLSVFRFVYNLCFFVFLFFSQIFASYYNGVWALIRRANTIKIGEENLLYFFRQIGVVFVNIVTKVGYYSRLCVAVPFLTVVGFIVFSFLELRFFSVFLYNFFHSARAFLESYFRFNYIRDYFGIYKSFFIGSKFFRFFTRELGEDLEETPPIADFTDYEEEELEDYINNNPAYFDMQGNSVYDEGYEDDLYKNADESTHYFDYWIPPLTSNKSYDAKPNVEIFADDFFERESNLFEQLFMAWYYPSFTEHDSDAALPPYDEEVDHEGTFHAIDHLTFRDDDWEGDEYHIDGGLMSQIVDEFHYSLPLPYDEERKRLEKFVYTYHRKLSRWHSFQTSKNFLKIPQLLRFSNVDSIGRVSFETWRDITFQVAKLIIPGYSKKYPESAAIINYPIILKLWERIDYEFSRNPEALHNFLSDRNEFVDIFNLLERTKTGLTSDRGPFLSFLFGNGPLTRVFSIFVTYSHKLYNFIQLRFGNIGDESSYFSFVIDYFNGLASLKHLDPSKVYSLPRNKSILFATLIYFRCVAENDFHSFHRKIEYLSSHKSFVPLIASFNLYSKYGVVHSDIELFERYSNKEIDYYFHLNTGTRYVTNRLKSLFRREWPIELVKYPFYGKQGQWWKDRGSYEIAFSYFIKEAFSFLRLGPRAVLKNKLFPSPKPQGPEYFMYGGDYPEDVELRRKGMSAIFLEHSAVVDDIWSTFNPIIDDLFEELYVLNGNFFYPSAFSDNLFEDALGYDDEDVELDIYDEYVSIFNTDSWDYELEAGKEQLITHYDELELEDSDTIGALDGSIVDEVIDIPGDFLGGKEEIGAELTDPFYERQWYNHEWWYFHEHADNDEGLEEWEPDEIDAAYDLDISVDRLFFGALKRKNTFPATDKRVFFGPLHNTGKNLDLDLDYKVNFTIAKQNNETKDLVETTKVIRNFDERGKYLFNFSKFFALQLAKILLYFSYYVFNLLSTIYLYTYPSIKFSAQINYYKHYLAWFKEYNALFSYKDRVINWIQFFEEFSDIKISSNAQSIKFRTRPEFEQYVQSSRKWFVNEPTSKFFNKNTNAYGRFWDQYPFTNYLQTYYYYTLGEFPGDIVFPHYPSPYEVMDSDCKTWEETPLTEVQKADAHRFPFTDLDVFGAYKMPEAAASFFTSDPSLNREFFYSAGRKRIGYYSDFPWFYTRSRRDILGTDFFYLDLIFLDDIIDDEDFPHWNTKRSWEFDDHPDDSFHDGLLFNYYSKNSEGGPEGHYQPNESAVDGWTFEETDWDIGTMVSYSSDDVNSHLDEFSEKFEILRAATLDFLDLFRDYTGYFIQYFARLYLISPIKYWTVASNANWLRIAAKYGIWVLFIRNIANLAIFSALFIYGLFAVTRISYYFFGEWLAYGPYLFITYLLTLIFSITLSVFIFKPVRDFYNSVDGEEKIEVILLAIFFWWYYILHGYLRQDQIFIPQSSYTNDSVIIINNNNTAHFSNTRNYFDTRIGWLERPEERGKQLKIFSKKPEGHRYFMHQDAHTAYDGKIPPDRWHVVASLDLTKYPLPSPSLLYNYIRFHLLGMKNENFIGYRYWFIDQSELDVKTNLTFIHEYLHRPQYTNWIHMPDKYSSKQVKHQLYDHVFGLLETDQPDQFFFLSGDRYIYNSFSFVNPLNPRPYALAHRHTRSNKLRSLMPYDFRPKIATYDYMGGDNYKFNARVYMNEQLTSLYNENLKQPVTRPFLFRRDVPGYSDEENEEDSYDDRFRTNKYKKAIYKNVVKTSRLVKGYNNLYKKAVYDKWVQQNIVEKRVLFDYSRNLRTYLFNFNPSKLYSIREVLGLALRDLVPNPEFFGKPAHSPISEAVAILAKRSKKRRAGAGLLSKEFVDSTKILVRWEIKAPSVNRTQNIIPILEGSAFVGAKKEGKEVYEHYYNRILRQKNKTYKDKDRWNYYLKYKHFNFITRFSTKNEIYINKLKSTRYQLKEKGVVNKNSKLLAAGRRIRRYATKGKSVRSRPQVLISSAHASFYNRMLRARAVSTYFRAAKYMQKTSSKEYFRENISLIDPYSTSRFLNGTQFSSFLSGTIAKKTIKKNIYDVFYYSRSKKIRRRSRKDSKMDIFKADKRYFKPSFERDRRVRRYTRSWRYARRFEVKYSPYMRYKLLKITYWGLFLDFIGFQDMFDEMDSVAGYTTDEYAALYKYHDFPVGYPDLDETPRNARRFLGRRNKRRIIRLAKYKRGKILKQYRKGQRRFLRHAMRRFEPTYAVEDSEDLEDEHFARLTRDDMVARTDIPIFAPDSLDVQAPGLHFSLTHQKWVQFLAQENSELVQKEIYFGPLLPDVYEQRAKKNKATKEPGFRLKKYKMLRYYQWSNSRGRVRIMYQKPFRRGFPRNSYFYKLYKIKRRKALQIHTNYLDGTLASHPTADYDAIYVTNNQFPHKTLFTRVKKRKYITKIFVRREQYHKDEWSDYIYSQFPKLKVKGKKKPQISKFEKRLASKIKIREALQDKRVARRVRRRERKVGKYYQKLVRKSQFNVVILHKFAKTTDHDKVRRKFFQGLYTADDERGMADIVLYRAKKRQKMLRKRKRLAIKKRIQQIKSTDERQNMLSDYFLKISILVSNSECWHLELHVGRLATVFKTVESLGLLFYQTK